MKLKDRYKLNKEAKVGTECICPSCNTPFIKENYQQAFCKSKGGTVCKDKYWNTITPSKRNNKTRISPANKAYLENTILPNIARERGFPDVETMKNYIDDSDGSWDAHEAHVEPCEFCGLRIEYCECGEGEHL